MRGFLLGVVGTSIVNVGRMPADALAFGRIAVLEWTGTPAACSFQSRSSFDDHYGGAVSAISGRCCTAAYHPVNCGRPSRQASSAKRRSR